MNYYKNNMKMIVHNLSEKVNQDYYESSDLSDYDLEDIEKMGVDEIWYYYGTAPYEGSGEILMRKGEEWDIESLSHCSCYGPTERLYFTGQELSDLRKNLSTEYSEQVNILFESVNNYDDKD